MVMTKEQYPLVNGQDIRSLVFAAKCLGMDLALAMDYIPSLQERAQKLEILGLNLQNLMREAGRIDDSGKLVDILNKVCTEAYDRSRKESQYNDRF